MSLHSPYVPQNKHDVAAVHRAVDAGFPAVEPVLDELLEWMQDANWPVARELIPFLASIGAPLEPHLRRVVAGTDLIWKYWVYTLIGDSPALYGIFRDDLRRVAESPTKEEKREELDEKCAGSARDTRARIPQVPCPIELAPTFLQSSPHDPKPHLPVRPRRSTLRPKFPGPKRQPRRSARGGSGL
jgi:hypothetical protein